MKKTLETSILPYKSMGTNRKNKIFLKKFIACLINDPKYKITCLRLTKSNTTYNFDKLIQLIKNFLFEFVEKYPYKIISHKPFQIIYYIKSNNVWKQLEFDINIDIMTQTIGTRNITVRDLKNLESFQMKLLLDYIQDSKCVKLRKLKYCDEYYYFKKVSLGSFQIRTFNSNA